MRRALLGLLALVVALSAAVVANPAAAAPSSQASNINNKLGGLLQTLHKARIGTNQCCANPTQLFTTGTNENGYDLSSIKIKFTGLASDSTRRPIVKLAPSMAYSASYVGTDSAGIFPNKAPDLDNAVTLTADSWPARTGFFQNATVTFNAPADTSLTKETDYFVHVEGKGQGVMSYTRDTTETASGGWSIADKGWWLVPYYNFWVHHQSRILPIDIVAEARTTPITSGQIIDDTTDTEASPADTTSPTPTLSRTGEGAVTDEFAVTVTFDEPTTGFDPFEDLEVTGGSIMRSTSLSDGTSHQAWIEPDAGVSEVTVAVAAGVAQDEAGNLSEASETLRVAVIVPLTASWTPPVTHDGTKFWIELRFSESPSGLSFRHLRDHIVTADGADVRRAKRLERGSNLGWRLLVHPAGSGDVTISLASSGACGTQTAICTADEQALSNTLSATITADGN